MLTSHSGERAALPADRCVAPPDWRVLPPEWCVLPPERCELPPERCERPPVLAAADLGVSSGEETLRRGGISLPREIGLGEARLRRTGMPEG